jgi:hypothetical protein
MPTDMGLLQWPRLGRIVETNVSHAFLASDDTEAKPMEDHGQDVRPGAFLRLQKASCCNRGLTEGGEYVLADCGRAIGRI